MPLVPFQLKLNRVLFVLHVERELFYIFEFQSLDLKAVSKQTVDQWCYLVLLVAFVWTLKPVLYLFDLVV